MLLLPAESEITPSVAAHLGVGESTVRSLVERKRSKFCVTTRAALVAEGFRRGYLD